MKKFITVALFITAIAVLAGCNTSGAGKKSAEATTEDIYAEKTVTPVELKASEYVDLGKYKGLTVDVEKAKVTDEEVEEEIRGILQGNVHYKDVDDRDTVQSGDYVAVRYTSTIDGKINDDYSYNNYTEKVGEGNLNEALDFAGLGDEFDAEKKLIGSKVGDPVTIEFTFPKDYVDESVAGKKCKMEIVVSKISEEVVPTLDEYLKEYEKGKTAKEKTDEIRKELETEAADAAEGNGNEQLWNQIVDNAKQKKDFTKEMIEQEKENVLIDLQDYAEFLYGQSVEDYVKENYNMTLDEYALFSLKAQCVQDLLFEAEGIKITDKDIEKEKKNIAKEEGFANEKEVSETYTDEEIRSGLATEQLFNKLLSYNKINIKESDGKSDAKSDDKTDKTDKADEATTEANK